MPLEGYSPLGQGRLHDAAVVSSYDCDLSLIGWKLCWKDYITVINVL